MCEEHSHYSWTLFGEVTQNTDVKFMTRAEWNYTWEWTYRGMSAVRSF